MNPNEVQATDLRTPGPKAQDISWITFFAWYAMTAFGTYVLCEVTRHPLCVGSAIEKGLVCAVVTAGNCALAGAVVLLLHYALKRLTCGLTKPKKIIVIATVIMALLGVYQRLG